MSLIYVSHPFSGKVENKIAVEKILLDLKEKHPFFTYISPIHTFQWAYDKYDYNTWLIMCVDLLAPCDAMYVYGDYKNSRGCMIWIAQAKKMTIPIFYPEMGEYFIPVHYDRDQLKRYNP